MKTKIIGTTNNFDNVDDMLKFSRASARVCYTEKDFEEVIEEEDAQKLTDRLLSSGHHSVFEHLNFTFYFDGIPKMLAMVFNNEKQYATSEKSARYTQMKDIPRGQKVLYDKWMDKLIPPIDDVYPIGGDAKTRNTAIKKLAQENARYMTSVFTPTKMVHTINLRQLNFLRDQFQGFIDESYLGKENDFKIRLADSMQEFLDQTRGFEVQDLFNQTDRHLSIFGGKGPVKEVFSDVYATNYYMSFAGLAQAHRHRTINYQINKGTELGLPNGFFVPGIVGNIGAKEEWIADLKKVAKEDYPQAQLLEVNERGTREDFRSKMILRMCGHAQWEIMKNTSETAERYASKDSGFNYPLAPKCQQDITCNSPCAWTGKNALDRIV